MAIPTEKEIPILLKSGDYILQNNQNQMIRMSYSNDTDKGYIDIAILNKDNKKDIQGASARIYISGEDNTDKIFGLNGKGSKKESKSVIYIEAENIKLITNKANEQQAILGNSTVEFLIEVLDLFALHSHPLESPPIAFKSQIEQLKKKAQQLLSKGIFLS